jgi:hypothetical protein
MGYAPLFFVHHATDMGEAFPKGAHIKLDRACPVRLPQLADTLTDKHERQPPSIITLKMIERATDAMKEGGKIQVVRDYGGRFCGKVFFKHLCAPFGRCDLADRSIFCGRDRKAFFIRF